MDTLPRIAMYIWRFPPIVGGAEKQCRILSAEFAKRGANVFIVTERARSSEPSELMDGVRVYRINGLSWLRELPGYVKRLFGLRPAEPFDKAAILQERPGIVKSVSRLLTHSLPNLGFFLSSAWLFYKRRREFDVIHIHEAHWIASFGVTIARLLKKKVIIKEVITGRLMTFKANSARSQRHLMRADLFIAISNKILADLISFGIPVSKIKKVPNGVELNGGKWQFDDPAKRAAISVAKLDLLSSQYKGLDILLQAWGILVQRHQKHARIRIFGRGNSYRMNQLAVQLGIRDYIEFPGFVTDVRRHLLDSCLFVLPSKDEGLSNALLEAMSLGLPCVATDISGNQDLIQNGINGLLVPREDPEALAEALSFMLDNPDKASEMGRNARRTIAEQYSISLICDKYMEVYNDLLKNGDMTNKCAA